MTKVLSPALYRVANRKRSYVLHHDRLKVCEDRAIPMWIQRKRKQLLRVQSDEVEGQEDLPVPPMEEEERPLDPDLDETVPYGEENNGLNPDLDATLPYGYETRDVNDVDLEREESRVVEESMLEVLPSGNPLVDVPGVSIESHEECQDALEDDNREVADLDIGGLFEEPKTTRSGRKVKPPARFRDFV